MTKKKPKYYISKKITILNETGSQLNVTIISERRKYSIQEKRVSIMNNKKRAISVPDEFSRMLLSIK